MHYSFEKLRKKDHVGISSSVLSRPNPAPLRPWEVEGVVARLHEAERKKMGVVDVVFPGAPETAAEAIKLAEQLAARKWDGGVYASIRMSIFPDACRAVGIAVESDEEKSRHFASRL